jgi:hypothetical protein
MIAVPRKDVALPPSSEVWVTAKIHTLNQF